MCPWAEGTRCWLRVGDLTHGWTMLIWCEEVPGAFLFISQWLQGHQCLFFCSLHSNITQTQWATIIWTRSAEHFRQLHHISISWKRQSACQPGSSSAFTSSDWAQCEKGYSFFFQNLFITLCFKDVFLFTSNGTQTHYSVDSRVWALAGYSNKKKAAYNNSHMKCHNGPSCMRYWLLTHSDTWALFSAENIFEFMDWQQNPLPCMPLDSIYSKWVLCNWRGCREALVEGCCAFELQSLTFHPLCPDHANDNKSVARGSARPFYHHQISQPECQRVISGWHGGDAKLNHHLALKRSHLAISVCQADRGVKPTVSTCGLPRQQPHTDCNHFGLSTVEWVRMPAIGSKHQHFFSPPLWLIKKHEKDQYSKIWQSASSQS